MAKTPSLQKEVVDLFSKLTIEERAEALAQIEKLDSDAKERRLVELLEEAGRLWAELGKKGTAPGRNYLLKKE